MLDFLPQLDNNEFVQFHLLAVAANVLTTLSDVGELLGERLPRTKNNDHHRLSHPSQGALNNVRTMELGTLVRDCEVGACLLLRVQAFRQSVRRIARYGDHRGQGIEELILTKNLPCLPPLHSSVPPHRDSQLSYQHRCNNCQRSISAETKGHQQIA